MITEEQATVMLREEAASYAVAPLPGGVVARQARRATRTRRFGLVALAGVATACAVAAGFALAPSSPQADTDGRPPVVAPPTTVGGPVAPPGYRLVGLNGVVVAVPSSWGTNEARCGTALANTVVFDSGQGSRLCRVAGDKNHSVVEISRLSTQNGFYVRANGKLDGVPVDRFPTVNDLIPNAPSSGGLAVPSLDVLIVITSDDMELIDRIAQSAQILPDGFTTVPATSGGDFDAMTAVLQAGLSAEKVFVDRPGRTPGSFLRYDPPMGSVVADGATIKVYVTRDGGRDILLQTNGAG